MTRDTKTSSLRAQQLLLTIRNIPRIRYVAIDDLPLVTPLRRSPGMLLVSSFERRLGAI